MGVVTCVKRLVSFRGVAAAGNTGEGGEAPGKSDAVVCVCVSSGVDYGCVYRTCHRQESWNTTGESGGILYWGGAWCCSVYL